VGPRRCARCGHEPELLLPAHGLPVRGVERVALVLGEVASALELLVGGRSSG
jgi:hypothetical protein